MVSRCHTLRIATVFTVDKRVQSRQSFLILSRPRGSSRGALEMRKKRPCGGHLERARAAVAELLECGEDPLAGLLSWWDDVQQVRRDSSRAQHVLLAALADRDSRSTEEFEELAQQTHVASGGALSLVLGTCTLPCAFP